MLTKLSYLEPTTNQSFSLHWLKQAHAVVVCNKASINQKPNDQDFIDLCILRIVPYEARMQSFILFLAYNMWHSQARRETGKGLGEALEGPGGCGPWSTLAAWLGMGRQPEQSPSGPFPLAQATPGTLGTSLQCQAPNQPKATQDSSRQVQPGLGAQGTAGRRRGQV